MTKVLIKHKDGSLSGPYDLIDGCLYVDMLPYETRIFDVLGLEVIPYEERKRVEITREQLAEFWDRQICDPSVSTFSKSQYSKAFKRICKRLGLE
jgi:hypothetical protein